jgi:hypothetical protein
VVGAALIVGSGVYMLHRETMRRQAPANRNIPESENSRRRGMMASRQPDL